VNGDGQRGAGRQTAMERLVPQARSPPIPYVPSCSCSWAPLALIPAPLPRKCRAKRGQAPRDRRRKRWAPPFRSTAFTLPFARPPAARRSTPSIARSPAARRPLCVCVSCAGTFMRSLVRSHACQRAGCSHGSFSESIPVPSLHTALVDPPSLRVSFISPRSHGAPGARFFTFLVIALRRFISPSCPSSCLLACTCFVFLPSSSSSSSYLV
jgi:hypothetical protein